MGQRGRQSLGHDFDLDDLEQLAFVQADLPHQVLAFGLDFDFVFLAVIGAVVFRNGQGGDDFHRAGCQAGLQQGMVDGQQVQVAVLEFNMGGGQCLVRGGVIGVFGGADAVVVDLLAVKQGSAFPVLAKGVGRNDGFENSIFNPAYFDIA